jgi:hypothetical protein
MLASRRPGPAARAVLHPGAAAGDGHRWRWAPVRPPPTEVGVVEEMLPAVRDVTGVIQHQLARNRSFPAPGSTTADAPAERLATAAVVAPGHAFLPNLRCGHYELAGDVPSALRLAAASAERTRRSESPPTRGPRPETSKAAPPSHHAWPAEVLGHCAQRPRLPGRAGGRLRALARDGLQDRPGSVADGRSSGPSTASARWKRLRLGRGLPAADCLGQHRGRRGPRSPAAGAQLPGPTPRRRVGSGHFSARPVRMFRVAG